MNPLDFSPEGSIKNVTIPTNPAIRNILTGTVIVKIKAASYGNAKSIVNTNANGTGFRSLIIGPTAGANALRFAVNRATVNLTVESSQLLMPFTGLNKWLWWAAVWNTGGVNGDQKLYGGDELNPMTEPTAYVAQLVGTGTVSTAATNSMTLGATTLSTTSAPIKIALVSIWDKILTLAEIRRFQINPSPLFLNPKGYWRPGNRGIPTVFDESGFNFHGTVVGAIPSVDWVNTFKIRDRITR